MADDYTFVPSKSIKKLETELNDLKDNPFLDRVEGKQMMDSVKTLHDSIQSLTGLFEKANEDLTLEQREARVIQEQLKPIVAKMDELADQNETIANGIVTIADMIQDLKKSMHKQPEPATPQMRPNSMGSFPPPL